MYVHTHWGYNRPYSARTWTDADWEGYLEDLSALGVDFVMVWPQLDCMPSDPTASDRDWLGRVSRAIDVAHRRFGMRVGITACANTIGNERAADFAFESRPYFVCEKKVNPSAPAEVDAFLSGRRAQLSLLRNADALVVIDSDPGGYIGSTNREFVELCRGQLEALRSFNPEAEFVYWMLAGWECYNAFWARAATGQARNRGMWSEWQGDDFVDTLAFMKERIPEPWWLFGWRPQHLAAVERHGLTEKTMCYPYGVIEGEPSYPLTNWNRERVTERFKEYEPQRCPRGIIGNAQTHCVQVPHTALFMHMAKGGLAETFDLQGFAEELLPGCGAPIARAWELLETEDGAAQREAAREVRRSAEGELACGKYPGLLFRDPERFLIDLAMNLELRAACGDLKACLDADGDARAAVGAVLDALVPYQARVGFLDTYGGPLRVMLNEQLVRLGDEGIDAAQADFTEWERPERRNGIVPRVIAAMEAYCGR